MTILRHTFLIRLGIATYALGMLAAATATAQFTAPPLGAERSAAPANAGQAPASGQSRDRSQPRAQADAAENPGIFRAENPMVIPINNVSVPAQTEGMLTEIGVEEGAIVEAGQILAVINDEQAQLTLRLKEAEEKEAYLNALNDINLRDAQESEKLAREEAEAYASLARERATPEWEARAKALEANRAKLRIELAELNEDIAEVQYVAKKSERAMAELEVSRRKIVAPFSGFVELRIAQSGEWVQPGSPIVQLVQMDRLRAQAFVSAIDPEHMVMPGMPAVLEFDLGGDSKERINGTIGFVGNDVDTSNRRRIWVEFANKRVGNDWLIKPGIRPEVWVDATERPDASLGKTPAEESLSR